MSRIVDDIIVKLEKLKNNFAKKINHKKDKKIGKISKIKIDSTALLTDGTFNLNKDKEMGDFYLKQTPSATSVLIYNKLGLDKAVPMFNNNDFISGCRQFLQDDQGLVEVVNTKTKKGNICAYSIIKKALQPFGMMYVLTMQLAYKDFIINIHGEFKEEGITGERDTTILFLFNKDKENNENKLNLNEGEKEWFRDPYDKSYKKGALMNISELAQFDKLFPNHPLSEARNVINVIINNN